MILQRSCFFFLLLFSSVTFTYALILTSHLCYFLFFFLFPFPLISWCLFYWFLRTHLWLRMWIICHAMQMKHSILFFYLAVSGLRCSTQDLPSSWWHARPWVATCTLSHGMQDLVPWPGIEPRPSAFRAQPQPLVHQGSPETLYLIAVNLLWCFVFQFCIKI